jgi:hypothetical protein
MTFGKHVGAQLHGRASFSAREVAAFEEEFAAFCNTKDVIGFLNQIMKLKNIEPG